MKLVIVAHYGDGCTWSCTETLPVEYESEEAFAVDFEEAMKKARANKVSYSMWDLEFAGQRWDVSQFFYTPYKSKEEVYNPPEIYTLEDWWEKHKDGL